ncbi:MAG TPA: potassium:proton antiporter, partial [Paenibacillus sp.]|nr:potassium:proton antiporter [Paenibacillus sp.]
LSAGLMPLLKPFSALYVLILAILGPLLAKESKPIYNGLNKLFRWSKTSQEKAKISG